MDIPFIDIPANVQRVIKFLIDRKYMVAFISHCFSCGLPEAAIFQHPNIIHVPFPSDLSSEELERGLQSCLEKYENELEAYYEFSVKLKDNLSGIEKRLSSEIDFVYHNYKDITGFLNHSTFEHLMLEYIALLEKLRHKVSFDIHNIECYILQRVDISKQFEFCKITPDEEKHLKSDFLTAYKNLSFEIDNSDRLRDISQRINQANKRKQIILPKRVSVKTKGSMKIFYYNPADLLEVWKELMEKVSFLPELI